MAAVFRFDHESTMWAQLCQLLPAPCGISWAIAWGWKTPSETTLSLDEQGGADCRPGVQSAPLGLRAHGAAWALLQDSNRAPRARIPNRCRSCHCLKTDIASLVASFVGQADAEPPQVQGEETETTAPNGLGQRTGSHLYSARGPERLSALPWITQHLDQSRFLYLFLTLTGLLCPCPSQLQRPSDADSRNILKSLHQYLGLTLRTTLEES